MAEMKYNDRLPHNYTDTVKKNEIINTALEDMKKLSDAVQVLKSKNIPVSNADEVKNINRDSVKAFVDAQCKKFLQAAAFIPTSLVNETKMKYHAAFEELVPDIDTITSLISKYKSLPLVFAEDGTLSYILEDLENYAEEKATVHITKERRDQYQAYKELYKAFVKCNELEKSNGWRQLSVEGFTTLGGLDGRQPITLSIWQILTGAVLGASGQELTPERFIHYVSRFL